jgi:glutamine amidotransferase
MTMVKKKLVIVDYGHGNLYSINEACNYFGYQPLITSEPELIINADSVILPGVGAFRVAMEELSEKGLIEPILEYVSKGNYLMGICLGMQLLFDSSEEFGSHKGLGLIKGSVKKFPSEHNGNKLRIPQIGWNKIYPKEDLMDWKDSPLRNIKNNDLMYFVHSYYVSPDNASNILSFSEYQELMFCSSVIKENIFGFQFHPEKSASQGLTIFENFLKL